jgi:hypothetical protein
VECAYASTDEEGKSARVRRTAGTSARSALWAGVTKITKQARAQDRAARLHQEALNCLTMAVKQEAHSAELIDEALKLAKRSRELNGLTSRP